MSVPAYAHSGAAGAAVQRRLFALPGGADDAEAEAAVEVPRPATLHAAAVALQASPVAAVAVPGKNGLRLVGRRADHSVEAEMRLAWTALAAGAPAACLMCDGRMEPTPTGGACRDCGTTLT